MRVGVYWRSFKELGGAPRVAVSIVDSLRSLGHEPVVLTNEYDVRLYPRLLSEELECTRKSIVSGKSQAKVFQAIGTTIFLSGKAKELDCLFLTGMYFACAPLRRLSNTKLILYVHAPLCIDWTLNPALRSIFKKLEARLYRSADCILSNSRLTRNTLREHLKLNSEVVYPPVETDFFTSSNHKQHGTIVSICRLHPKKRSDQMINLFRQLKGNYRFALAGALANEFTEYGKQLMATATQDPRVSVLFNPTDSEIKSLYKKATVFWYTYTKEEFGLPVAEAMSCSTPVVALRGGGVNEIIVNNQTGFLASSEEDFLEKTSLLLNNDDLCRQMGAAARRRVEENFSTQVFTEKIRSVLRRSIAEEHIDMSLV